MVTFTFTTPATVGTLGNQTIVKSLQLTGFSYSSTPQLAPLGTGEMEIVLTDPDTGWQETIDYQDASVLTFMAQAQASGSTMGDALATAVFAKLVADSKLPAGTVSTTTTQTTQSSTAS